MKAESAITGVIKPPRNNVYSRPAAKRVSSAIRQLHPLQSFSPSSCGVTKSRSKSSVSSPRRIAPSQSSESLLALELQRKRQQQIIALEREVRGLLEEEYRDDVKSYMHQMEVRHCSFRPNPKERADPVCSSSQCALLHLSICNPNYNGTCVAVSSNFSSRFISAFD